MNRNLVPKKILIVDDNQVVLRALAMSLRGHGYVVVTAEDGGAAARSVRTEKPDLIVLDIRFPPDVGHGGGVAWDGFLISDWLRRMEEGKSLPLILITSDDPAQHRQRATAVGAAGLFQKPVPLGDLLRSIRRALGEDIGPVTGGECGVTR